MNYKNHFLFSETYLNEVLGKMKKDKPYQSAKHTKRLRATLPALYYLLYAIVEKTKAACGNPFPAV